MKLIPINCPYRGIIVDKIINILISMIESNILFKILSILSVFITIEQFILNPLEYSEKKKQKYILIKSILLITALIILCIIKNGIVILLLIFVFACGETIYRNKKNLKHIEENINKDSSQICDLVQASIKQMYKFNLLDLSRLKNVKMYFTRNQPGAALVFLNSYYGKKRNSVRYIIYYVDALIMLNNFSDALIKINNLCNIKLKKKNMNI